ncbi:cingulin-like protein 1 isoform X1 [Mya arenaria]|uniref:cingulin-like protein 1 isoform X1 n=1 Tax=Mya arenaria TaxID=6604 RepID=UPI0022E2E675|nr:cingulin-like protein 1 isoform X1 [Mya arenaria]XP_052806079.1 cingulin-like protein 1 isoform X1 [Mya arenaria]
MSKSKQSAGDHELIESLRFKIKELEHEVSTLRSRLDGLRKAKNTTITKREREVVEVGFKRDPHYDAKIEELEKKLKEKMTNSREMEELKKQHAEQLAVAEKSRRDLQKQLDELYARMETERKDLKDRLEKEKGKKADNNDSELYKLRTKIAELEGDKSALMLESNDLKERVNSLCLELSVKEAKWCEREEQYKLKLKQQWGDKYAEWMAETERKIKELEETNQMLRMYLHRSGQGVPEEGARHS